MNNVTAVCPSLKSPEAKVKRVKLIALTKEPTKQYSLDSVLWLNFMNDVWMNCNKFRKEKNYKVCGLSNKRAPGSTLELNTMFKEIHRLREW